MDLLTLSNIDDELISSEVAALCFLCRDVLTKKRLKTVNNGKELFTLLATKDLLRNSNFLCQLLNTIKRGDLLSLLEGDETQTDSNPILSDYRVMLYNLYEDMTVQNLQKVKFLLGDFEVGRGQIELCTTALDVFALMENSSLLSEQRLDILQSILEACDSQLVKTLQTYSNGGYASQPSCRQSIRHQDRPRVSNPRDSLGDQNLGVPVPEMRPQCNPSDHSAAQNLLPDSDPSEEETYSLPHQSEQDFYELKHNPRGTCMVINNESFSGSALKDRPGTKVDEDSLQTVFGKLGFRVEVRVNLTAEAIRKELKDLGNRSFYWADVLVVCVLSHGEKDCVFGTDGRTVTLGELRAPFTCDRAPTLAGKPKLFFIQACQGSNYQRGALPCPPRPQDEARRESLSLEEDAGPLPQERVAEEADFLMGMATVEECKSFRHVSKGSIYIQELCRQLLASAKSHDDILSTLTRVNREVSKGEFLQHKQMPQPKYTLTKKLLLTEMNTRGTT